MERKKGGDVINTLEFTERRNRVLGRKTKNEELGDDGGVFSFG